MSKFEAKQGGSLSCKHCLRDLSTHHLLNLACTPEPLPSPDLSREEIKALARDGGSCTGCQWDDPAESKCILTGDCHRVVVGPPHFEETPPAGERISVRISLPNAYVPPIERALATQVGGGHYKGMAIQPFEYIHKNGIGFAEGCAIKYLSRWKLKGGVEDLRKARHFIDLLIGAEVGS